jgi:hypothetical protein
MSSSKDSISKNYFEGGNSQQRSRASDRDQYEDDGPQEEGANFKPVKPRIFYADWTRVLAIQLVIFIHCLVNAADASGFDPEVDPGV